MISALTALACQILCPKNLEDVMATVHEGSSELGSQYKQKDHTVCSSTPKKSLVSRTEV
jgi:hypothetical protein